jgi:hypothetical protein
LLECEAFATVMTHVDEGSRSSLCFFGVTASCETNRAHDRWAKERYFGEIEQSADLAIPTQQQKAAHPVPARKYAWWKRLWPW